MVATSPLQGHPTVGAGALGHPGHHLLPTLPKREIKLQAKAFKYRWGRARACFKAHNSCCCCYSSFGRSFPLISTPWGCKQKIKSGIPGADWGGIYYLNATALPRRVSSGQTLPCASTRRSDGVQALPRAPTPPAQLHLRPGCPLYHPCAPCLAFEPPGLRTSAPQTPQSHP